MLSHIWFGFFALSFASGLYQWQVNGNEEIFILLVQSTFDMASLGVEIAIGLVGVLSLWLGFFEIAEKSGLIALFSKLLTPLFRRLMPEIPPGHPALGAVTMNLAANALGLDNAATPMGLKAMQEMQSLNTDRHTASNAQILFLVLNTSSVTLLPVTVFLYRAQQGAEDPGAVFVPILLATSVSTLVGLMSVVWIQRLKIYDFVFLGYFAGFALIIGGLIAYLSMTPSADLAQQSSLLGNLVIFCVIIFFLGAGIWNRVPVYETFIEGARKGFGIAIRIIPYLIGMLVAIGVLRTSGILDGALRSLEWIFSTLGFNTDFIQALPTALMKPLSGSGARAMMLETMNTHGVDSFPAVLAAVLQGSTETTFYVLAIYFGSVGIRRVRYALACGLLADFAGIITAILVGYWFFH